MAARPLNPLPRISSRLEEDLVATEASLAMPTKRPRADMVARPLNPLPRISSRLEEDLVATEHRWLQWRHGRRRPWFSLWRRSGGPDAKPARVRRAAGRDCPGSPARAIRDPDAEHRRRADRGGAAAGVRTGRRRRAGNCAPRRDARAVP